MRETLTVIWGPDSRRSLVIGVPTRLNILGLLFVGGMEESLGLVWG